MCFGPVRGEYHCICDESERVLRAYGYTSLQLPAMTSDQRQWCLDQIVDGEFDTPENHLNDDDAHLARAVLDHWRDCARDKGLY
jgi:hypothetical protein